MTIPFFKLRVGTDDFLLVDCMKQAIPPRKSLPLLARRMLDRRFGAGANGLILLGKPVLDLQATVLNADGTPSPYVDDALLCIARYLFDSALVGSEGFGISAGGENRKVDVIDSRNFRISLGSPYSSITRKALSLSPSGTTSFVAEILGNTVSVIPVHLRTDSAVIFWRDTLRSVTRIRKTVRSLAPIARYDVVPVVVRILGPEELEARVAAVDRSSRASAAGAALSAAAMNGFCGRFAQVRCEDVRFAAEWSEAGNEIKVSGTADYAFEGTYYWDEGEN